MPAAFLGLAAVQPPHQMSQQQATDLACCVLARTERQQRLLQVLYRRAGVSRRRTVLPYKIGYRWAPPAAKDESAPTPSDQQGPTTAQRMQWYEEHAGTLVVEAARKALAEAGLTGRQITHLVTVSCTGFTAPGVDLTLVQSLGLPPVVQRAHIGFMGCHGAINGLRVAQALVHQPASRVLLAAVELCSLHFCFSWKPDRFLGNALFADGAAAVVLAQQPSKSTGPPVGAPSWELLATGSCFLPDSADLMTWRIGDHGFEMTLSAQVPEAIHDHLKPWLEAWLDQQGLRLTDISCWAIHPGGPRILSAVEDALNLDQQQTRISRQTLDRCGNMSSPTVLFVLDELRKARMTGPCVALGFGPGLVAEAALLRR